MNMNLIIKLNYRLVFPVGKKYNQPNPMKNKIEDAMNAGIKISRLLSSALFRAVYNNHICKVTLRMRIKISVDNTLFILLGFALFWLVLKLLIAY